mmetsp:Transcript_19944/g.79526  ORF Transcript_19944/g.79526 Transcript_19944/m.79526 type:complete len:243 (+) Transcript_19944:2332-3060(+)
MQQHDGLLLRLRRLGGGLRRRRRRPAPTTGRRRRRRVAGVRGHARRFRGGGVAAVEVGVVDDAEAAEAPRRRRCDEAARLGVVESRRRGVPDGAVPLVLVRRHRELRPGLVLRGRGTRTRRWGSSRRRSSSGPVVVELVGVGGSMARVGAVRDLRRARPTLEERGEAARRLGRGVDQWLHPRRGLQAPSGRRRRRRVRRRGRRPRRLLARRSGDHRSCWSSDVRSVRRRLWPRRTAVGGGRW